AYETYALNLLALHWCGSWCSGLCFPFFATHKTVPGVDMDDSGESSSSELHQCRICWGEAGDPSLGLALVSPCKCAGTLNYLHVKCLEDWQRVLRAQGQYRKAKHCEICKQPYHLTTASSCGGSSGGSNGRWSCVSRLISRLSQQMFDVLSCCRSYTDLLYRCWKLYILGCSMIGAARAGVAGLRAGFGMGRTLVEEQTGILLSLLSAMGEHFGTPYAELLWCQAVACVAFALVSELFYTSLLGMLAGGVIGFFRGYLTAVYASISVVARGVAQSWSLGRGMAKAAGLALRLPWGALRAVTALVAKKLPVRVL
ncbi:hypothetical protein Vretimale_18866, partial [Volvox reticuliferus]